MIYWLYALLLATVSVLATATLAADASAQRGGPGGSGTPPPNPDIVYLSTDNGGLNTLAAIRGITFSSDGSARDSSLFKNANNREPRSIAWSPDGTRFAWLEATDTSQRIMVASPGKTPAAVFTVSHPVNYPVISSNLDSLAWGPGCEQGTTALLFRDDYGVRRLVVSGGSYQLDTTILPGGYSAFAFSPTGQQIVSASSSGIWVTPACESNPTATLMVTEAQIDDIDGTGVTAMVHYIDWAPDGRRLAISFSYSRQGFDPWADIKVVELNYCAPSACAVETVSYGGSMWLVPASANLPFESSELSPVWGPPASGSSCPRLAFARSTVGSRYMYLASSGDSACSLANYSQISGKSPRALDWK